MLIRARCPVPLVPDTPDHHDPGRIALNRFVAPAQHYATNSQIGLEPPGRSFVASPDKCLYGQVGCNGIGRLTY
jgi:hypothetical protein